MIVTDPEASFVLVSDSHRAVVAYRLDRATGRLIPSRRLGAPAARRRTTPSGLRRRRPLCVRHL